MQNQEQNQDKVPPSKQGVKGDKGDKEGKEGKEGKESKGSKGGKEGSGEKGEKRGKASNHRVKGGGDHVTALAMRTLLSMVRDEEKPHALAEFVQALSLSGHKVDKGVNKGVDKGEKGERIVDMSQQVVQFEKAAVPDDFRSPLATVVDVVLKGEEGEGEGVTIVVFAQPNDLENCDHQLAENAVQCFLVMLEQEPSLSKKSFKEQRAIGWKKMVKECAMGFALETGGVLLTRDAKIKALQAFEDTKAFQKEGAVVGKSKAAKKGAAAGGKVGKAVEDQCVAMSEGRAAMSEGRGLAPEFNPPMEAAAAAGGGVAVQKPAKRQATKPEVFDGGDEARSL